MIQVSVKNYQELASKTCKDLEDLQSNIIHMKMGMITEVAEIVDILKKKHAYGKDMDITNFKEELGDIFWYIANYCEFMQINISDIYDNVKMTPIYDRENNVSLYEITNAFLFEIINTTSDIKIERILDLTLYIIELMNFSFDEILRLNIRKLQVRYPHGFTEYHAINRDLDKERNTLENK